MIYINSQIVPIYLTNYSESLDQARRPPVGTHLVSWNLLCLGSQYVYAYVCVCVCVCVLVCSV